MKDKNKEQKSGDSSTNLQSESITIVNHGINYKDAKEIALDVFNSNFIKLSQSAEVIARERAEEITNHFLEEVNNRFPEKLSLLEDPAMLSALYSAQKEYAKTGDNETEEILVDLLVDRISEGERNIRQLVLNESLVVVTKLTSKQMDALTVSFILTKTRNYTINNLENFRAYLTSYIFPFVDNLSIEPSTYEHLAYTGCASLSFMNRSIEDSLKNNYKGIFSKGFSKDIFHKKMSDSALFDDHLIPCFHNTSSFQLQFIDDESLINICKEKKYSQDITDKLKSFLNENLMTKGEIGNYLKSIDPLMEKLLDVWSKSSLSQMELTSVGTAIAQANFKRKTNNRFMLSIWIKE